MPVKVLDIDLCQPWPPIPVESRYQSALALIRWQDRPLSQIWLPVAEGKISFASVWQVAYQTLGHSLARCAVDFILFGDPEPVPEACDCTVIVCTRNRTADLRRCVESIQACRPRPAEVIIVDNAPSDDSTARLMANYDVRYIREPRKGLNWARARGCLAATRDLVLFTDDDVVVDPKWVDAMCRPFDDPQVGSVTGLVLALELETPSQEEFERYAGFSKGFADLRYTAANLMPAAAGNAGVGASMGFRRKITRDLRLFEAELDCGTAALSGGDNYGFYKVLANGYAIYYTPRAICWHRHRRTEPELRSTLYGYSVGVYSFLLRCFNDHHDWTTLRVGAGWFLSHHVRNLLRGLFGRPGTVPLRYTIAEIKGAIDAVPAYRKSRRTERALGELPEHCPEGPR